MYRIRECVVNVSIDFFVSPGSHLVRNGPFDPSNDNNIISVTLSAHLQAIKWTSSKTLPAACTLPVPYLCLKCSKLYAQAVPIGL